MNSIESLDAPRMEDLFGQRVQLSEVLERLACMQGTTQYSVAREAPFFSNLKGNERVMITSSGYEGGECWHLSILDENNEQKAGCIINSETGEFIRSVS